MILILILFLVIVAIGLGVAGIVGHGLLYLLIIGVVLFAADLVLLGARLNHARRRPPR